MTLYIVCYDIPQDKRRLKVARQLEGAGQRVQRSVFECHLSERQWKVLRGRLLKLLDEREDSLRVYRLERAGLAQVEMYGAGPPLETSPDVFII